MPAAGWGVSALLFQQKQRKKLKKIDLKDLNKILGEIRSRIGSSLEEEKEMIESQRIFGWPSKFLCVWVWVGVWETDWTLTHQNQIFCLFFQPYLGFDIINCTIRLVESQAEKMNQVIAPCEKVWFAINILSLGRVVCFFKLILLQFSGVIEPFNAE